MLSQHCLIVNNSSRTVGTIKKGLNRNCARSKIQYPMKNLSKVLQITVQVFLAIKHLFFG